MVEATQTHADDQNDGQIQLLREVGAVAFRAQRNAKTACAFDQHHIGALRGISHGSGNSGEFDVYADFLRGDVRSDGGGEQVRIADGFRQIEFGAGGGA